MRSRDVGSFSELQPAAAYLTCARMLEWLSTWRESTAKTALRKATRILKEVQLDTAWTSSRQS